MPKKRIKKENQKIMKNEKDEKIFFALLAVLLSIIGFLIAFIAKRDDKYIMFYAKQSFVLFIAAVIVSIFASIIHFIPFIGSLISVLAWAFYIILWIFAIIYSLSGEIKETPVIGHFARDINL